MYNESFTVLSNNTVFVNQIEYVMPDSIFAHFEEVCKVSKTVQEPFTYHRQEVC